MIAFKPIDQIISHLFCLYLGYNIGKRILKNKKK